MDQGDPNNVNGTMPVMGPAPPNYGGIRLVASIWSMWVVASAFLGARCYCKFRRHMGLWWDDGILIAAWACITIESALLTYAVTLGYGYHGLELPPELWPFVILLFRAINVAGTFSITAAIWSKTSFAVTLLRLTEGRAKHLVWFIIVSMNIAMGLSAVFIWAQCTPIQRSWDFMVEGTCWDPHVIVRYNIFSAAYSATMDIALAMLPWKLIWGLQMKKKEKIGVAIAMSCGLLAGITAIVKTTKIPTMLSIDPYDGIDLFIWGNAESCVTIVAASIPILRVLIRDVKTSYRRYYVSGGAESGTASARRPKARSTTHESARHDDASERSILGGGSSHGKTAAGGEVVIEFQDWRDVESLEYKLGQRPT